VEDSGASRVMVVDDEALVLDVMRKLLSKEPGLTVATLENGEQARDVLEFNRFDLLITDKNLPGMGGVELIHQARRRWPMLEAVMITGYASAESVIAAFAAGASDYLLKPFDDIRVVRAKVRAALDRRVARLENREQARRTARAAAALLGSGQEAPDAAWQDLEERFQRYERSIHEGGQGDVRVVGAPQEVEALRAAGIGAALCELRNPLLDQADVVVLTTGGSEWLTVAERLKGSNADVVLVSGPEAGLADLLEAVNLRLELVPGGSASTPLLVDRVRSLLLRRQVERAQVDLAQALERFSSQLR
jgi:DNA-binding response OmpR family regulator